MTISRSHIRILLLSLLLLLVFSSFSFAYAWRPGQPLVPCGTQANPQACNFASLLVLIQNLTQFLLFLAVPVATLLFAYAGYLYVTDAGREENLRKAKSIFFAAFWGVVLMASAWLIIKVIVTTLAPGAASFLGS